MPTSAEPSSRDIGNAWIAHILGELFDQWPRRADFNAMDVRRETRLGPRVDEEDLFDDLLLWLRDNGFVRYEQSSEGNAFAVALTEKGFAVLGTTPVTFEKPLGAKMKEAARAAAGDARKTLISSLVKLLVTGIASQISG